MRSPSTENKGNSVKFLILPRVMDILSQGGPLISMERATRKIYVLKFRFEAREAGFQETTRTCGAVNNEKGDTQCISTEERRTVDWLAVMFDTLSSSIN